MPDPYLQVVDAAPVFAKPVWEGNRSRTGNTLDLFENLLCPKVCPRCQIRTCRLCAVFSTTTHSEIFCGRQCVCMMGTADIEGSKSNVAMNAWLPQASYQVCEPSAKTMIYWRSRQLRARPKVLLGLTPVTGLLRCRDAVASLSTPKFLWRSSRSC